jgi:hypothetical protein
MNFRQLLKMGEAAAEAFDIIEKLTNAGGPKAAAALVAIRVIIATLKAGFAGELAPQVVLSRIELLNETLSKNDATAMEALAKKFGKK